MMFFIVGNRYGGGKWELLSSMSFSIFEAAQMVAAKMPLSWSATIVSTTEGENK